MNNKQALVRNWIIKAEHDKGMAELALKNGREYTDSICFHCQQYVEKLLKAVLISLDVDVQRTHSLTLLLDLLADKAVVSDTIYEFAESLQDYAVGVRYPADDAEPTEDDAELAYAAAVTITEFLKGLLTTE